jgi:hypothetical protein
MFIPNNHQRSSKQLKNIQSAYGVNYKNPGNKKHSVRTIRVVVGLWDGVCRNTQAASHQVVFTCRFSHSKQFHGRPSRGPMLPSLSGSIIATRTRSCDIFCKADWQGRFISMVTHEPHLTLLDLFLLRSVRNYIYMITFKPWPIWKNESKIPLTRYQARHVLQRAWQEVELRLEIFTATICPHVQTYYVPSKAIWFVL